MTSPRSSVSPAVPHRPFWKGHLSREIQFVLDFGVLLLAFVFAYLLRFDFAIPAEYFRSGMMQILPVAILQFLTLFLAGIQQFVWRYVGLSEIHAFAKSALYSATPLLVLRLVLPDRLAMGRIPISVILVDTFLAFGGLLGLRVLRRLLYERYERTNKTALSSGGGKRVLLVGAGRAGVMVAREIQGRGNLDLVTVGFVDDDPNKRDTVIQGIKVLGSIGDLPQLVRDHSIDHVILTIAEASRPEIRRIVSLCEMIPIKMRIIPGFYEILEGKVEISRIRDVEIEDLLGREPVDLDEQELQRFLTGKRVMVTGAGGSIGSELAWHVARFEPAELILVERAEFALFEIDRALRRAWPELTQFPVVADVGDERRMRSVFDSHRPHLILHAAAHKHVPMMEKNSCEAIKNNVLATRLLGELAGEMGTETFVLVSTDKAVRPTSIMGASKRVAELVMQDLDRKLDTRFVAVRFGNVMGSTGSVISIFREQIKRGGPVTVTHPDMVRYFMTIPEAAQLVLQAGAIGHGGEILILDMGEPVRILELAKEMITLSALRPYDDIDIVFTGVRPGEKLFEEFELTQEQITKTRHPKIYIGRLTGFCPDKVGGALHELEGLAQQGRDGETRALLAQLLPEANLGGPWPRQVRLKQQVS